MGKTICEKILSAHSTDRVEVGQIIQVNVDLVMGNDVSGSMGVGIFNQFNSSSVFDPDKVVMIADHFVPNKDIKSAEQVKVIRDFAKTYGLKHYYENEGIEHALLPLKGLVGPGQLIVGADSHSVTYGALGAMAIGVGATDLAAVMMTGWVWLKVPESIKITLSGNLRPWVTGKDVILYILKNIGVDTATYKALEFVGPGIENLTLESRFTMSNMTAETGAKTAIFPVDDAVSTFLDQVLDEEYQAYQGDEDGNYAEELNFNLDEIDLQVAFPSQPSNGRDINDATGVEIDQVVIGSCTNGWIEDLRLAAKVLKNNRVKENVRLIILPATRSIYRQALNEGLLEIFDDAGAVIGPPTCGPCLGGHMGILAKGERAIATTNRNFVGRMGHKESEVYLSGPAVAAASAVKGKIAHPEEVV